MQDILQEFQKFFERYFKNFNLSISLKRPCKSREILDGFYYLVKKFIKAAQNWLKWRRAVGNAMKILEIFWRKSIGICKK